MTKLSPLAPERFPDMPPIAGVRLSTAGTAIRYHGREDVLLVELVDNTAVGGVLTRSRTASAPVKWCRKALLGGRARGLVVNAGNANAFTGRHGDEAVAAITAAAATLLSCSLIEVFVAATGIIGEPIPHQKLTSTLATMGGTLRNDGWEAAARAIMTTDTFPKGCSRRVVMGGVPVTINGFAKGSGMIAPDMATMLAFVFTDATISPPLLQTIITDTANQSFNRITVDSDTSTSDTLLLFATGQAPHRLISDAADEQLDTFRAAVSEVCLDLAHQVVKDGEGASKFVTITITGATDDAAARRIALSIGNSPLVKTAIAGEDANWGRIIMAIGKADENIAEDRLAVQIGSTLITADGAVVPGYREEVLAAHMRGTDVRIIVDVGVGHGQSTVWTCDLTHGYIDINASYRS